MLPEIPDSAMDILRRFDSAANPNGAGDQSQQRDDAKFNLTSLRDLLAEPEETIAWILEGILPAGGMSQLNGKPKAGKSTFARCLALAVAQGEEFLNRATAKGAVLYLALEEKRSEVRKHFEALGATGEEAIFIHADRAPANALLEAQRSIKQHKPALVIIDPLLKFVRVKDSNDYAQVMLAMEPVLALARESGAHVLLVHHAGKSDKADPVDSAIGTTGFAAAVDTVLVLKRSERYRTLQTVQRYGTDFPETVLNFDPERRAVLLGAERSKADADQVSSSILEHLKTINGGITEADINEAVEGRTKDKCTAIRELFKVGKLTRDGSGKRGDPYRYSLSPDFYFPPSQYISGSRKVETENVGYPAEKMGEIPLPENLAKPDESNISREVAFFPSGAQTEVEL